MSEDEIAYLSRRANQEYLAAEAAEHPSAAASHRMLATLYADKLRWRLDETARRESDDTAPLRRDQPALLLVSSNRPG